MARQLLRVKEMAERGPLSEGSLRWLIFNERQNGLFEAGAVVRVGRRCFIDAERFDAWIDAQNDLARAA